MYAQKSDFIKDGNLPMPASDQGVYPDRYRLIPRTLIFITRGQKVLLLKGALQKRLWAGLYNGIGGHVEKGEDILGAARRELIEETGLSCDGLWLCGTLLVDTGQDTGIAIFILRGEMPSGEPVPSPEGDLEWVGFSAIHDLPLVEDLYRLLPRVLAAKIGDPPFSARSAYDARDRLVLTINE